MHSDRSPAAGAVDLGFLSPVAGADPPNNSNVAPIAVALCCVDAGRYRYTGAWEILTKTDAVSGAAVDVVEHCQIVVSFVLVDAAGFVAAVLLFADAPVGVADAPVGVDVGVAFADAPAGAPAVDVAEYHK